MKITDKKSSMKPKFGNVLEGDCFIYESTVYLKTEEITDEIGDMINVINLENGALGWFANGEIVEPVEAELLIK